MILPIALFLLMLIPLVYVQLTKAEQAGCMLLVVLVVICLLAGVVRVVTHP